MKLEKLDHISDPSGTKRYSSWNGRTMIKSQLISLAEMQKLVITHKKNVSPVHLVEQSRGLYVVEGYCMKWETFKQ